jgi:hypothetical protein
MESKLAPTGHNGDSAFNLWGAAFSASSEPDFWGRVRRPARNSNTSKGVVDFVNELKVQGALLATQEQWVESSTGGVAGHGWAVQSVGWGMGVGVSAGR